MDHDDFVFGMVHRIEDLIGGKPPVLRVQNSTHHRNREKALQITVRVIIKNTDSVAESDTEAGQRIGQSGGPGKKIPIGQADPVAIDNFPVRRVNTGAFQNMPDEQLVIITLARCVCLFAAGIHPPTPPARVARARINENETGGTVWPPVPFWLTRSVSDNVSPGIRQSAARPWPHQAWCCAPDRHT